MSVDTMPHIGSLESCVDLWVIGFVGCPLLTSTPYGAVGFEMLMPLRFVFCMLLAIYLLSGSRNPLTKDAEKKICQWRLASALLHEFAVGHTHSHSSIRLHQWVTEFIPQLRILVITYLKNFGYASIPRIRETFFSLFQLALNSWKRIFASQRKQSFIEKSEMRDEY